MRHFEDDHLAMALVQHTQCRTCCHGCMKAAVTRRSAAREFNMLPEKVAYQSQPQ